MGVHWRTRFLEGVHEKPIYRGKLPKKRGTWIVWQKKRGGVFEAVDTQMHTIPLEQETNCQKGDKKQSK